MSIFPGMTLDRIAELTLVQYMALHAVGTKIMEDKIKAGAL